MDYVGDYDVHSHLHKGAALMEDDVQRALRRVARMHLRQALVNAEHYGVSLGSANAIAYQVYSDADDAKYYADSELRPNPKES